ncbi:SAF domain-containing protein, partial [Streptococcus anginosus]|nr:SAF domain-containing protein [Streptococcus anginosus]
IISSADIRVELLPVSTVGSSYATDADEITGLIAQIDIAVNDPISTHMARDAPLPPTGTTVIEVRLASNPDDLLPGDSVQLASAVGCAGEDCVLAEEALVM